MSLVTWGLGPSGGPAPPPTGDDLETVLVSALTNDPALAALVGDRIFPVVIPQTAADPALCYRFAGSTHGTHLRGAGGLRRVRVRFEARSALHSDVAAVAEVVRNRFQGLIGAVGSIYISYVAFEDVIDDYDEPPEGSDLGAHRKQFDLRFTLPESIPTLS